jgi:apolipoprotein N-acyltransferase
MQLTPDAITARFSNLGWKSRGVIMAALGVIIALGHAPIDLWPFSIIGLAISMILLRSAPDLRTALWHGWALGVGYFGFSLRWIISPFLVHIERDGWMAPFAVILMAAGFALFWMLAAGISRKLYRGNMISFALLLVAVEALRSLILTGFPWALLGHVLVPTYMVQMSAYGGPHFLTLLVSLLAAGLAYAFSGRLKSGLICVVGLPLLALAGTFVHMIPESVSRPLDGPMVRLIQPNAPQDEKWDLDKRYTFFDRMIDYTGQGDVPDLVVWPESAIPSLLNYADTELETVSDAARGAPVIVGVNREDGGLYHNSFILLGRGGAIDAFYDKQHLVPFGEYVPGGDLLHEIGIQGFGASYGGGFTPGQGRRTIDVPGIGAIRPLICYEGIFAEEVGGTETRPRALVLITNDAWFGKAAGPFQHLAQARLRAIEQGLPMIRVANTGVSAMIDAYGHVTASIPMNTAGFLDVRLPDARPPTLYSKYGDLPILVLLIAGLCVLTWRRRQF